MGLGDINQYHPLKLKKTIDISFVGNMYKNRKDILEKLSEDFPNLNLAFYGKYVTFWHPIKYIKFIFSKKKKAFKKHVMFIHDGIHLENINEHTDEDY